MSAEWPEQYAALPAAGMDLGVWGANDIAHRSFEKALDPLVRSQPLLRRGAGAAFANRQAKRAAAGAPSRAPPRRPPVIDP